MRTIAIKKVATTALNTTVVFNRPTNKYKLENLVFCTKRQRYFDLRCYNGRLVYQLGRDRITFKQLKLNNCCSL